MQPPRDPILRAIWRIAQAKDLTSQERLALLALWRVLGDERKPVGPGLLAFLIGTTPQHARNILKRLKTEGYLDGRGKANAGRGKCAVRWLTRKAGLPKARKRGSGGPVSRGRKGDQALPRKGDQALPLTKGSDMRVRTRGSDRTQARPAEGEDGQGPMLRITEHWPSYGPPGAPPGANAATAGGEPGP